MPKSTLILYEPIEKFGRMTEYWSKYVSFYEEYWGGPTSPYGVWFGDEYSDFQNKLLEFLGVQEIQDCLFMKSESGEYLISPFRSFKNRYMLHSENIIPLHWFIPFDDDERSFFYTHMGFGRIYYGTNVTQSINRIMSADSIIEAVVKTHKEDQEQSAFILKLKKIQSDLFELKAWLTEFDTSGYLVLDYGELCSFITPYSLNKDHSVKDIWNMLNNLNDGKIEESGRIMNSLYQRWETVSRKVSDQIIQNKNQ